MRNSITRFLVRMAIATGIALVGVSAIGTVVA